MQEPTAATHDLSLKGNRILAAIPAAELQRGGETLRLLLLYAQALLTQMTQTAACNRHHRLNQPFCRWLLMSFDRLGDSDRVMTQQLIAKMLGVRSEEVTVAAQLPSRGGADAPPAGLVDASGAEWSLFCPGMGIALESWLRLIPRLVRLAAGSAVAWALAPPLARTLGQTLVQALVRALVQTPAKPRL